MIPFLSPSGYLLKKSIDLAFNSMQKVSETGTVDDLRKETLKQELQARVAQELAIAERISNAAIVEIEEYYDNSGEGNIGLNVKEGSLNLGASGEGRKVSKRIYKFKGFNLENQIEVDEEDIENKAFEEMEVNFTLPNNQ